MKKKQSCLLKATHISILNNVISLKHLEIEYSDYYHKIQKKSPRCQEKIGCENPSANIFSLEHEQQ